MLLGKILDYVLQSSFFPLYLIFLFFSFPSFYLCFSPSSVFVIFAIARRTHVTCHVAFRQNFQTNSEALEKWIALSESDRGMSFQTQRPRFLPRQREEWKEEEKEEKGKELEVYPFSSLDNSQGRRFRLVHEKLGRSKGFWRSFGKARLTLWLTFSASVSIRPHH